MDKAGQVSLTTQIYQNAYVGMAHPGPATRELEMLFLYFKDIFAAMIFEVRSVLDQS